MNLTENKLKEIGFEKKQNLKNKVYYRKSDKITLYEYNIPTWSVQLDGYSYEKTNLMLVSTEEMLNKAISERNL